MLWMKLIKFVMNKITQMQSKMVLRGLHLEIFLGWPKQERVTKQLIICDVDIQFSVPPKGCVSDDLDDTICYDQLIQDIKLYVSQKQFHLIEHLAFSLYQHIKDYLSQHDNIALQIHLTKKPQIENLTQGVTFSYGDALWSS